jgi:cytochrome c-type biogenesis protein CcmH/NrfG
MLQKAISLHPNDALGYSLLAGYYNRQGQFEKTIEAWKARAKAEPNNPEAHHMIAVYYYDKLHRDTAFVKENRAKALEYVLDGIASEDRALALNAQYFEALTYKNILLRQQALLEKDPARIKQLLAEADVLKARAEDLQKKQNAAAGAAGNPQRGRGK